MDVNTLYVALLGIAGAGAIIALVIGIVRLTRYDAPAWFVDADSAPEDPTPKPMVKDHGNG